jgi:hypothetical protein
MWKEDTFLFYNLKMLLTAYLDIIKTIFFLGHPRKLSSSYSPPQEPEIPRLHLVQAYAHEIVLEVLASDLGRFTGSGLFVFLLPSKMS